MVKTLLVTQAINPFVDLPPVIPSLGYVPVLLCPLGVAYLWRKGNRTSYGLTLGAAALLGVLAVFFSLHYGTEIVYYRGLNVAMLMVSILAGAGLGAVMPLRGTHRRGNQARRFSAVFGPVTAGALVAVTLALVIPARLDEPYYHMIEAADYPAFNWVRENGPETKAMALVDPWKGMAFAGVAEIPVFSWVGLTPDGNATAAYQFMSDNCTDTVLLRKNGITVVYTMGTVTNAALDEVTPGVYVVRRSNQ
jgi:4-amino-4-deoxy-L-arabinose transferase-like glycosyltransferase